MQERLCARLTMLSSMHNDLLSEFEQYATASEMWQTLINKYGMISSTKLHELKFNTYKKKTPLNETASETIYYDPRT